MGKEMAGRFIREGIYVYLWLIHVEVSQKTTKFCKAVILQLKNKFKKWGKWITNKDLLYSTGNSAQYYEAVWMGWEFGEEWIHVYVWLSCSAIHINSNIK